MKSNNYTRQSHPPLPTLPNDSQDIFPLFGGHGENDIKNTIVLYPPVNYYTAQNDNTLLMIPLPHHHQHHQQLRWNLAPANGTRRLGHGELIQKACFIFQWTLRLLMIVNV